MSSLVPGILQDRISRLFVIRRLSLQDRLETKKLITRHCKRSPRLNPRNVYFRDYTMELYDYLQEFLRSHVLNLLEDGENAKDENVLHYYAEQWKLYQNSSEILHDVFTHPNGSYRRRRHRDAQEGMYVAYRLAMVIWRDHLFLKLHERVTKAILKLFERERKNESVDMNVVRHVIPSYIEMDLTCYEEYFEKSFLRDTERFYTSESVLFMKVGHHITEYVVKANQWLQEESERVKKYQLETTNNKLMSTCKNAFISKYLDCFYAEIPHLLAAGDEENLRQMHSLLSRVEPGIGHLKSLKYISFMAVWEGLLQDSS